MENELIDTEYIFLLKKNNKFHKEVMSGKKQYASAEWQILQKKLLLIELAMPVSEIVKHAQIAFHDVCQN